MIAGDKCIFKIINKEVTMKGHVAILAVVGFLISSTTHADPEIYDYAFTTHTADFLPTQDHEVLSFQQGKVILFLKWKGLEVDRIYSIQYQIVDGATKTVKNVENVFKSSNGKRNTWIRHNFDENENFPGDWNFVVKLDGKTYLKRQIYVGE